MNEKDCRPLLWKWMQEFWIGFRKIAKEMGKIATLGLASLFWPLDKIFQDLFLASVWQRQRDHRIPNSFKRQAVSPALFFPPAPPKMGNNRLST